MGLFRFSYAIPMNSIDGRDRFYSDETERFQFTVGGAFLDNVLIIFLIRKEIIMKNKYLLGIIAVFVFVGQPVFSQDSAVRIGVVDMNKLLQESPQYQDMLSAVEEEFAPRVRDIEAKEASFNESRDQLQQDNLALSNDERQNATLKLASAQRARVLGTKLSRG